MKKLVQLLLCTILLATTMICSGNITDAQPQMRQWYMKSQKIDVTSVPTLTAQSGMNAATYCGNAIYDNTMNHNLLFYVADGILYDANNAYVGVVTFF